MIRLPSGALLLLMLALPASAADQPAAYVLRVDNGRAGGLKLQLHVEMGGRLLQLDDHPARQPHGEVLTRALVEALDRDHDGKLTKAELRAAEKVLLEKDADEDECLTPFELAPSLLLDEPPANGASAPQVSLSLAARGKEGRPDQEITVRLDDPPSPRLLIRAGGLLLDVGTQAATPAAAPPPRKKLKAAADRLVTLTVSPRPRSWFVLLDANGDGQLSRKELRGAWDRLADAEARKAGFVLAPDWTAPALTLTFVRGSRGPTDTPLLERPAPARGPSWFVAMDRNRDGYVSPSEFIGTPEQFRRLDRDGDGLLGPEEAEAGR
jgi:Ca2+-binding EF-hand superfamily protein